jgi:hypothetical protein
MQQKWEDSKLVVVKLVVRTGVAGGSNAEKAAILLAPPARLERATPGLGILCSVQLS